MYILNKKFICRIVHSQCQSRVAMPPTPHLQDQRLVAPLLLYPQPAPSAIHYVDIIQK